MFKLDLEKAEEQEIKLPTSRLPPVAQMVKNQPAMRETWVRSLGWEEPLEKGTATHSSILAWRIPWSIPSMGSVKYSQPQDSEGLVA